MNTCWVRGPRVGLVDGDLELEAACRRALAQVLGEIRDVRDGGAVGGRRLEQLRLGGRQRASARPDIVSLVPEG